MSSSLQITTESTLTDRYQTTIPETVRRALNLRKRDKIRYTIRNNGEVLISGAAPAVAEDPVVEQFLEFLQNDMSRHPEHLQAVDTSLLARINSLLGDSSGVDFDTALGSDDE